MINDQRGLLPVQTPTMVSSIAETIRGSILAGRYAPGDRLVEAELARLLAVSRGPIREALALLERDGIVVSIPRRGKFVPSFTLELIDELYSFRRILEPAAVDLVIEKMNSSSARRLERAVATIAKAAGGSDVHVVAVRDIEFHDLLYELSAHDLLRRAWVENVAGKLRILLNVTNGTLAELADAERQHRRLLEPMLAGDAETTRRRLVEHIDEAWERARTASASTPGVL